MPFTDQAQGLCCKLHQVFSVRFDGSMGKYVGHVPHWKKQGSITYCTDQENEISKIFILYLGSNGEERFLFKQTFEFSRCTIRYSLLN